MLFFCSLLSLFLLFVGIKYFLIKNKLNKSKALIENEHFSIYLKMDRKVRNSISHFDYELENNSPKILFHDNEKDVEMYLVDFAKLCYGNIVLITYLNELFYSIEKYDYINKWLILNIKFKRKWGNVYD